MRAQRQDSAKKKKGHSPAAKLSGVGLENGPELRSTASNKGQRETSANRNNRLRCRWCYVTLGLFLSLSLVAASHGSQSERVASSQATSGASSVKPIRSQESALQPTGGHSKSRTKRHSDQESSGEPSGADESPSDDANHSESSAGFGTEQPLDYEPTASDQSAGTPPDSYSTETPLAPRAPMTSSSNNRMMHNQMPAQSRPLPRSTIAVPVPPLEGGGVAQGEGGPTIQSRLNRRTDKRLLQSLVGERASRDSSSNINPITSTTMNLDMGSERLLIKPASERPAPSHWSQPGHQPGHQMELLYPAATGSFLGSLTDGGRAHSSAAGAPMLLMMSPSSGDLSARMDSDSSSANLNPNQLVGCPAAACYTGVTLMMVVLMTMTATLVLAFMTHYLLKLLGRRQFDLIQTSKQFESNQGAGLGSSSSRFNGPSCQKQLFMLSGPNQSQFGALSLEEHEHADHHFGLSFGPQLKITGSHQQRDKAKPLGHVSSLNSRANELEHCAFDNPYFRAEESTQLDNSNQLRNNNNTKIHGSSQTAMATSFTTSDADSPTTDHRTSGHRNAGHRESGLLALVGQQQQSLSSNTTSTLSASNENQAACSMQAPNEQQPLQNFIEHHISNLHSRQVTSSVKELTISGRSPDLRLAHGPPNCELRQPPQIVDLRNDPRIMAKAVEGDLVAVDLSGRDFMGLGFDVCGSSRDGIFIRSLLANGPARETGLIQAGDRIKCLNINFDGVTLQDARDILNCGAPYKLRLLVEKGSGANVRALMAATSKRDSWKKQSTSSRNQNQMATHEPRGESSSPLSAGPLSATRSYIKRLVSPLAAGPGHKSANAINESANGDSHRALQFNYHSQQDHQIATSYSESEIKRRLDVGEEPGAVGGVSCSLATKRHLSSGDGGSAAAGAMLDLATIGAVKQRGAVAPTDHDIDPARDHQRVDTNTLSERESSNDSGNSPIPIESQHARDTRINEEESDSNRTRSKKDNCGSTKTVHQ